MKALIEKELCSPKSGEDGYAEIAVPLYYVYAVDEETGEKELLQIFDRNIEDAARFAQRKLDINLLEIAYKENPNSFKSTCNFVLNGDFQPTIVAFDMTGVSLEKQNEILELLTPIVEKLKQTK